MLSSYTGAGYSNPKQKPISIGIVGVPIFEPFFLREPLAISIEPYQENKLRRKLEEASRSDPPSLNRHLHNITAGRAEYAS
jgi:hypothetical protein